MEHNLLQYQYHRGPVGLKMGPPTQVKIQFQEDGFHVNPDNEDQFFICRGGHLHVIQCPGEFRKNPAGFHPQKNFTSTPSSHPLNSLPFFNSLIEMLPLGRLMSFGPWIPEYNYDQPNRVVRTDLLAFWDSRDCL